MNNPRIIVALDFGEQDAALDLVRRLDPRRCRLKVGKELFTRTGPVLVERLAEAGFDVFLDLKFHDIPNTVAAACRAAADMGVWMLTVHACGGRPMLEAAREALDGRGDRPMLIAVTVLTSLSDVDLRETGVEHATADQVRRLAGLARSAGTDGVVCSVREAPALRREHGRDFCLVTPGIRPAGGDADDQKRVATPVEALTAGSDYLVIGRPITRAGDPLAALNELDESIRAETRSI